MKSFSRDAGRARWIGARLAVLAVFAFTSCESNLPSEPQATFALAPDAPTLLVGTSVRLDPVPAGGGSIPSGPLKWSTTDGSTVSVDANGVVRGIKAGSATVKAISPSGTAELTVAVIAGGGTVRAGIFHTCGITTTDGLYCWGNNQFGQLGIGVNESPVRTPRKVAGGFAFSSVSAGWEHTCGIATGGAYCWGSSGLGQAGNGTTFTRFDTPTRVTGGEAFTFIEVGGTETALSGATCSDQICNGQSCALNSSGVLYCWGADVFPRATSPQEVPVTTRFRTISVGYSYICGIDLSLLARCWGSNAYRQSSGPLANGTDVPAAPIGIPFQGISAAADHTCALSVDGDVYCWGANNSGQLGAPTDAECRFRFVTSPCRGTPVRVDTPHKFLEVSVSAATPGVSVSPALSHTCALTTSLEILCWGANFSGQLGNGSRTDAGAPTPISSTVKFRSVTAGLAYTCGIAVDGSLYCWGFNGSGQLGDGTSTDSTVPVKVAGLLFR
jgi:alpha-tubulin suppressor-like RCC1 family protein